MKSVKKFSLIQMLKNALDESQMTKMSNDLQIAEASDFFRNPKKAKTFLKSGAPILLENVSDNEKKLLFESIGLQLEGHSDFLFFASKPISRGIRIPYLIDGGILETNLPEPVCVEEKGSYDPVHQPVIIDRAEPDDSSETIELTEAEQQELRFQNFCDSVIRTLSISENVVDPPIPPALVYKYWYYTKAYNWPCSAATKKHAGAKPKSQATNGTITYKIEAYLDEAASGSFQWVFLTTLGFWATNGMNANNRSERGWAIGTVGVDVPNPPNFMFNQSSPTNTNKKKQVTTSASFEVDTDGKMAYGVSNSETKDTEDWESILDNYNSWTFRQSSPFKGSTQSFPKSAIKYNAGKARHEVKSLPVLSTKVYNFCTMSVWRNAQVSKNTIYLRPTIDCQYFYLAVNNVWPTYKAYYWWQSYSRTENLRVDLSLVSEPKRALATV